jgi:hypothetical protein
MHPWAPAECTGHDAQADVAAAATAMQAGQYTSITVYNNVVLHTTAHPRPIVMALVAQHNALSIVVRALQAMAHPLPTVLALVAQRGTQLVVQIVVRALQDMAHPPPSCRALVAQRVIIHCCLYAVSAAIMTYAGDAAI